MYVKKSKGKVYGAVFTKDEQKAIDIEVKRQLTDYIIRHYRETDAIVLYTIHKQLKYGPKRLKAFYNDFAKATKELMENYEMEDDAMEWACTHELKEMGIDLEAWENEAMGPTWKDKA